MSYATAKEARDRALVEALHGSNGDTGIRCLGPVGGPLYSGPRQPAYWPDDLPDEPGWNSPSFAIDSSLIFGGLTED